jgi:hypothetical protein
MVSAGTGWPSNNGTSPLTESATVDAPPGQSVANRSNVLLDAAFLFDQPPDSGTMPQDKIHRQLRWPLAMERTHSATCRCSGAMV